MRVVRRVLPGDVPRLLEISCKELGSDYLSEEDFMEESGSCFCNVVEDDGIPVGFAICRTFGPEEEAERLGLPEGPERDLVLSRRLVGILDSVAVADGAKGTGAGTALCERSAEEMKASGCELLCAMAWKSAGGRTNISGILTRMGMAESVSIKGYWNRMVSSPEGHHCPECGAPCRCYGVFWYKPCR
jgi:GNAT superfamily N-acetyltransferase